MLLRSLGLTRTHLCLSPLARCCLPIRVMASAAAPRTLFDKIVAREIPSTCVYEDELVYAFRDITPTAPTHILIVPKVHGGLTQLQKADESHIPLLGRLLWAAAEIARREGLAEGYRVVVNDGPNGCQSVYHLHLHLIGGKKLSWPPGTGAPEGSMTG